MKHSVRLHIISARILAMEKVQHAISTINEQKEWVSDMFQRVGSSFRRQRAQSECHFRSISPTAGQQNGQRRASETAGQQNGQIRASEAAGQQNGQRRASEAATYDEDSSYYNRLKKYCLNAFGEQKYNGKRESYDTDEDIDVRDHNRSERLERNEMTRNIRSISISVSITNVEALSNSCDSNSCIHHTTRRKSEAMKTERVRLASAGNGNKYSSRNPIQPLSRDSGVSMDFGESFDEHYTHPAGMSASMCKKSGEKSTIPFHQTIAKQNNAARMSVTENQKTKVEVGETLSKNVSCAQLGSIQNKASNSSRNSFRNMFRNSFSKRFTNRCTENSSSFSCNNKTNEAKKTRKSYGLPENDTLKVNGTVTLGLQHFQKSRQLRVILLTAETSVEHNRKMCCKVTLIGNSSSQKQRTQQLRSDSGNADFTETFYIDLRVDDFKGYVLKVQLRTVSRFLQRQTTVGVAYIALENIDLTFDTTLSVKLRDPKPSRQFSNKEDMEIISGNSFIDANVSDLLQDFDHPTTRYYGATRHLSLPQCHHDSVFTDIPKRAMTLDGKIRATVNRQES